MVSRGDRIVVLWPEYFDSRKTRRKGRKVPREYAVSDPTVDEIARAAESLGITPIVERDACYPAYWWRRSGRVLLRKVKPKTVIVSRVGRRLKHLREKKGGKK